MFMRMPRLKDSDHQAEADICCYRHKINREFNRGLFRLVGVVEWLLAFITAERALRIAPNGGLSLCSVISAYLFD